MKFTKAKRETLREFLGKADAGGCMAADAWTCCRGRHTKARELPPFVHKVDRRKAAPDGIHESAMRAARGFFEANPRRSVVLVFDRRAFEDQAFEALSCKEV